MRGEFKGSLDCHLPRSNFPIYFYRLILHLLLLFILASWSVDPLVLLFSLNKLTRSRMSRLKSHTFAILTRLMFGEKFQRVVSREVFHQRCFVSKKHERQGVQMCDQKTLNAQAYICDTFRLCWPLEGCGGLSEMIMILYNFYQLVVLSHQPISESAVFALQASPRSDDSDTCPHLELWG